jgi:FkbM family methyltransferase
MIDPTMRDPGWTPPTTLKERVVNTLLPGWLSWRLRAEKAWRKERNVELRHLEHFVDPTKTSVDVGANRGVYTYYLARHSTHVYAYEPHPKMFRILSRSAKGRNVTVSPAALSNVGGAGTLVIPVRADGSYSNQRATLRQDLHSNSRACSVSTRRLDDEEVGRPGFIKIDVEGAELNVLRGAEETLREHKPVLLIEIDERWSGRPRQESLAFVLELGYQGVFFADGIRRSFEEVDPDPSVRNFFFLPR